MDHRAQYDQHSRRICSHMEHCYRVCDCVSNNHRFSYNYVSNCSNRVSNSASNSVPNRVSNCVSNRVSNSASNRVPNHVFICVSNRDSNSVSNNSVTHDGATHAKPNYLYAHDVNSHGVSNGTRHHGADCRNVQCHRRC